VEPSGIVRELSRSAKNPELAPVTKGCAEDARPDALTAASASMRACRWTSPTLPLWTSLESTDRGPADARLCHAMRKCPR
jgi:hypothetical protein